MHFMGTAVRRGVAADRLAASQPATIAAANLGGASHRGRLRLQTQAAQPELSGRLEQPGLERRGERPTAPVEFGR